MAQFDTAQVRHYYDRHTAGFVAYGQGGALGAIHRAVWGPGATTREQAFRYVEDRIADQLHRLVTELDGTAPTRGSSERGLRVLDLGCGVGSSLCYLAEHTPIQGTGVTLSPVQARLAMQRVHDLGMTDRIRCVEADYCDLPDLVGVVDLAYAIEAFVHGPDPNRFFAECSRRVRPRGLLVICDDFRRTTTDPAATATVERFRRGWHINTLVDRGELRAVAASAGFQHELTVDLTSYLELGRVRDRVIDALVALAGWLPAVERRYDHLIGGSALQTCLSMGWIGYDLAIFRHAETGAV